MSNANSGGGGGGPGGFSTQVIYSHMPELLNENSDTPNLLGIFWDVTLVWLVIISLTLVRRKKS